MDSRGGSHVAEPEIMAQIVALVSSLREARKDKAYSRWLICCPTTDRALCFEFARLGGSFRLQRAT